MDDNMYAEFMNFVGNQGTAAGDGNQGATGAGNQGAATGIGNQGGTMGIEEATVISDFSDMPDIEESSDTSVYMEVPCLPRIMEIVPFGMDDNMYAEFINFVGNQGAATGAGNQGEATGIGNHGGTMGIEEATAIRDFNDMPDIEESSDTSVDMEVPCLPQIMEIVPSGDNISSYMSYVCNIMDTSGHVDFPDETTAALRLADGVVLIVDASEGVVVDRLIIKLKLSPEDAYLKIEHTIQVLNNHITTTAVGNHQLIDPIAGNIWFASASAGWCFTPQSFAKLYLKRSRFPLFPK
ncbi:hypothetical protein L6452_00671 [Arctium lappa]|uniref:Uncharacterized protein n=1 Tax=Arctium lappa TaxID=4217 RepID=A0ACB9FEI4_ARCLA|nr:hypothetical protein L6452_00671 [Arctium lappa]